MSSGDHHGKEWRSISQISQMRSRSPNSIEVPSIGVWNLAIFTPQCGGGYQRRVTDPRRL
jgi:hypothetical protein